MGRVGKLSVAVSLLVPVFCAPARAYGLEDDSPPGPLGAIHPELAGRMMIGAALNPNDDPGDGIGSGGFGVRGGLSYRGFYGGLSYVSFFGGTAKGFAAGPGFSGSDSGASYGVELGYGHTFFRGLTLRGLLGAGEYLVTEDGWVTTCPSSDCTQVTTTPVHGLRDYFYFAPGVLAQVALGPVTVGLDATLFYLPSAGPPGAFADSPHRSAPFFSFMGGAQLGVRL